LKIFNAFAHIFAIFAFLTIGSLLMIVAFHILTLADAQRQIQEFYMSPWHSTKTAFAGLVFISVGLTFSRMLLKKRRQEEALIYQSEIGPIVVSVTAMEDVIKKVLKRFHLVKEWKTKVMIQEKDVEIKLRLVLWSGGKIQDLLIEIQEDVRLRIRKLLGNESKLEITCDVQRIEDHDAGLAEMDHDKAASM
jgi:heme/copper-type cytochrome/quinol oxidase subunit 1